MSESWEQLKADFKRIFIEHYGKEIWNNDLKEGKLPEGLQFTQEDLEK